MSTIHDLGPLVTADWLDAHIADTELRIADCRWYLGEPERGREAYEEGHLPGARYVDLDRDLSAPTGPGRHPLPAPEAFAARMGELGIGDGAAVVAHDDRGGVVAARLWWMLRWIGHERVAVLDGGLPAWVEAGHGITAEAPEVVPAEMTVRGERRPTVDRDRLQDRVGDLVLLDARDGDRYRGETEPIDPVAGHIPTALSAPTSVNLDEEGRFLPPTQLRARYEALGVHHAADAVAYCGSGVTACHDLLAMEVAGLGVGTLYPGSWSDWSTAGMPVATGAEPG